MVDRVDVGEYRRVTENGRLLTGDDLISSKLDEPVFTTRLSVAVTVHNLKRAFNVLLDELDLKTGADGRTLRLYS